MKNTLMINPLQL